jgi:Flp pilus assembly protein CpaB
VLVIDALDAKTASGSTFGRTVTLEVTPEQAEKVNAATELGKLSLKSRSVTGPSVILNRMPGNSVSAPTTLGAPGCVFVSLAF